MRKIVSAVIITACIFCIQATAQESSRKGTPPNTQTKPSPASAPVDEEYIIGAEDQLDISVFDEPKFDVKQTVRPDGKIGVKLLGDVQAAGLTTKQVEMLIAEGLKPAVLNARVTVIVLDIHSKFVTIMGNGVAKTGSYPIGGPMRVVDLLARAGLNDFAKKNEIVIFRPTGNASFTKFPFDYDAFAKGNYLLNILLRSGDTVIVP